MSGGRRVGEKEGGEQDEEVVEGRVGETRAGEWGRGRESG